MTALDSRWGATVDAMTPYARRKDELFATLTGTVLEIGAGRGANFGRLPSAATWIGLEPDRRLRARLARRAVAHRRQPRVLAARGEAIPLPDASVDAVVATVVLCSVADPSRVMREVRRVLRPGGRFVFVEHVGAEPGTTSRRLQTAFAPLTRRFDRGCDPTRRTATTIRDAGFSHVDIETYGGTGGLALYSPHIAGVAIR
jgi:ubiquinone/menaquinone biosynthesis C-methylase UbiE